MSLRVKGKTRPKTSAFAVFKKQKANSMTDVYNAGQITKIDPEQGHKSKSASTTPTREAPANLTTAALNHLSSSKKKDTNRDLKKLRKLLKTVSKGRPAYLPDGATMSPLSSISSSDVRSLRPRSSTKMSNYDLPLKATPERQSLMKTGYKLTPHPLGAAPFTDDTPSNDHSPTSLATTNKRKISQQPPSASAASLPAKRGRATQPIPVPLPAVPTNSHRRAGSSRAAASVNQVTSSAVLTVHPAKKQRVGNTSSVASSPTTSVSSDAAPQSPVTGRQRTEPMPQHPIADQPDYPTMFDSTQDATKLFECLIHPVQPTKFFNELWEKKPLLVKRHMPDYNCGWFSTKELHQILQDESIAFGTNIDVTTYENGVRETHNPEGRAYPPIVWDFYQNGCSVRLLNPQTYSKSIWKLLSILQEYFGTCVGANVYLTPPGSQGFAPHYDDIEAFVVQLEGRKHWKLYSPRSDAETLPQFSSGNFSQSEIGEPILDVILEAGDLLYFPRGTIHQAVTLEDDHSLHITVSCNQKNSWGELLKQMIPRALDIAFEEDIEFRRSLPREYLQYMGIAFSDSESSQRLDFLRKMEQLMMKLISHIPVDAACDEMGRRYIQDSLPPVLTEDEKKKSVHSNGPCWDADKQKVVCHSQLEADSRVKLIRRGCVRMMSSGEQISIYHNLENARLYRAKEPQVLEIAVEFGPGIEFLLQSYPSFVSVDSFPLDSLENKIELASLLFDKGLLLTSEALKPVFDTDSSSSS